MGRKSTEQMGWERVQIAQHSNSGSQFRSYDEFGAIQQPILPVFAKQ